MQTRERNVQCYGGNQGPCPRRTPVAISKATVEEVCRSLEVFEPMELLAAQQSVNSTVTMGRSNEQIACMWREKGYRDGRWPRGAASKANGGEPWRKFGVIDELLAVTAAAA